MSTDLPGLRTRLADLADAPAPPSPFDAAATAARGRRRVLASRASAVGGGGALVTAAVVGIVMTFAPGAQRTAAASSALKGFPMVKLVDFGWLPASLPNVSYAAAADGKDNDVIAEGDKSPNGAPRVDLQLMAGHGPGTVNAQERLIPATLDDGRHAFWVTQAEAGGQFAGDFQLRFPAKDGRWVSLTWGVNWNQARTAEIAGAPVSTPMTSVPASAQWQRDLLRMATQVTDVPSGIPMPMRLSGIPAKFTPGTAFLWRPGQFGNGAPGTWSALISFSSGKLSVEVDVGPHGSLPETAPKAGDAASECKTSAGLDACVQTSGSSPEFERLGGAKGMLDHITLLGTGVDQWTTSFIVP